MNRTRVARFQIGQVVRHRLFSFRGVIFDIDPEFNNNEEWYQAIPAERRPRKDQPFYHLFAENAETEYVAYVSEQNLLPDTSGEPVRHPQVGEVLTAMAVDRQEHGFGFGGRGQIDNCQGGGARRGTVVDIEGPRVIAVQCPHETGVGGRQVACRHQYERHCECANESIHRRPLFV